MIELTCDAINNLNRKYGSAFYIFNQDEFEDNYNEVVKTFTKIYPNYRLCYSYKTNYTPHICQQVKKLGGYAEVVSDMEYELALKVGYAPKEIVYNGPAKGKYLKQHILSGGINNIDRIEEAEYICLLAKENSDKKLRTGIRVNFDIDAGYTSRFGIGIEKLGNVIELLRCNGINVSGLHCHMSRARGIEAWELRAKTMINLIRKYHLDDLEYISLGSGMYGKMDPELKLQFPADAPNYEQYAIAVLKPFAEFYSNSEKPPIIFTEPGTTIISKYIDFIGEVRGIKDIRNQKFVLMNCSFHNLGETCQMKNLPIKIFKYSDNPVVLESANFVGYTCLEQDVLYRNFSGEIGIGDKVLFGNVGGYSIVDKPPFIMPNVPMIAISHDKDVLIKKAETSENIFATFVF